MKLPVAGGSYQTRQIAASAMQCLNWYPETIEDPSGSGKATKILRETPGFHLLVDLSLSGLNRGFWSGGGRLFVCIGTTIYELASDGSTVSSHVLPGSPGSNGKPVQMFGSPNQLAIVADGYLYVDNGTPPPLISFGPLQVRFQIAGIVTVVTAAGVTTATWTAGDKFPTAIAGIYVLVSGVPNYVISRTDSTHMVLTDPMGSGGGTVATFPGPPVGAIGADGVVTTEPKAGVYWQSGTLFNTAWEGRPITIGGFSYVVDKVLGPYVLSLTTNDTGQQTAAVYSVVQTNLTYSGAAGALVTAVTGAFLDNSLYVQRPSAAVITYTDLVIDAGTNTNVTSAAHPFNETQIGEVIIITGGTGFTTGTYTVAAVDWAHIATLSAAVGTVGSTGGTGTGYPEDLGRQVNFSAVNDFTDWRGLDFFQKESQPDYIQSIFADRGQMYLFGMEYETEAWANDLNTGRPVRTTVIPEASACRFGVVSMGEHIYFIGGPPNGNPVAYRMDGFTPTRISTHAVEAAWAQKSVAISTAVAWSYIEDGHLFWVICFSNGSSWCYDATEKDWQERTAWDGAAYQPYRPWFHTFIPEWGTNGQHIVGDYNSGKVFILSSDYFDEEGADVKRVRVLPYIYAGGNKRTYVNRVDLTMATGLIPSGAEPTVTLEWSLDNGKTFTAPDPAGFGAHDETDKRVFWLAQGSAETAMLPRISITGQVQTTLIDCEAEVYLGDT